MKQIFTSWAKLIYIQPQHLHESTPENRKFILAVSIIFAYLNF